MTPVPPERHLLRAKDIVDARFREPLDVPALARAAYLSPAHFSREFRRAFGETPHQYLLTRRLERAAALLRNTDRSVADICFDGRPAQRRLVHDELPARLRNVAYRLPRRPPAGRARAASRPASCRRTRRPHSSSFREDSERGASTNVARDRSTRQKETPC